MKNTIIAIAVIVFFIVLLGGYTVFENNLEESAYELINNNLWLGIPLILIGYVVFETIKNRFGKQLMDSTYVTEKVIESQKESKGTGSWFIFHYLNGKCPYCKNNFLSEHISKKHSASDKILKCSKCKALCVKTFPDKWVLSPSYVAGGIVFLSELAGEHEIELIVGSFLLSLILSSILTKFWINEKYIEN